MTKCLSQGLNCVKEKRLIGGGGFHIFRVYSIIIMVQLGCMQADIVLEKK